MEDILSRNVVPNFIEIKAKKSHIRLDIIHWIIVIRDQSKYLPSMVSGSAGWSTFWYGVLVDHHRNLIAKWRGTIHLFCIKWCLFVMDLKWQNERNQNSRFKPNFKWLINELQRYRNFILEKQKWYFQPAIAGHFFFWPECLKFNFCPKFSRFCGLKSLISFELVILRQ